jgi:hypothetical protein
MTVHDTSGSALYVDTSDGTFTHSVALLNNASGTETASNVDVTVFGTATWIARHQALQSASWTGGGFFDYYDDTTGQKLVMDNAVNGAALWFKNTYEGTYYVKSRVELTDFTIKTSPQQMITFTFTADSTGTITHGSM